MIFDPLWLVILVTGYLVCVGFAGVAGGRGWPRIQGRSLVSSLLFVLPLGVYASAWAFLGAVGTAYQSGYGFLAIYLGISGCYLLAPVLLTPLLEICRTYQLTSIADLFTFRYRSQGSGTLISVFLALASLPLLLLQFKALEELFGYLLQSSDHAWALMIAYWSGLAVLVIVIARNKLQTGKPDMALSTLLSFEMLVKLVGFTTIGLLTLYQVFNGFSGLDAWLVDSAQRISSIDRHLEEGPWRTLLLIFFGAALTTPHMFHMLLMGPSSGRALFRASWLFPALLLVLALPIPVVLWAGIKLSLPTEPEFFLLALGVVMQSPLVSGLTVLIVLAAVGGVVLVTVVALSSMLLNHVVLPTYQPVSSRMLSQENLYRWLTTGRQILAIVLMIAVAALAPMLPDSVTLSTLGLLSFSASLQLLPGILAVTYWPTANRLGIIFSLIAGIMSWVVLVALPYAGIFEWLRFSDTLYPVVADIDEYWHVAIMLALGVNITIFVTVSLVFRSTKAELSAAQACSFTSFTHGNPRSLSVRSVGEFSTALASQLGETTAAREVRRACRELDLSADETRPYALRRLRDRLEANLSGLLGPALARDIVKTSLSAHPDLMRRGEAPAFGSSLPTAPDITFVENKLERYHDRLTGLAGELDRLRRYHRQILLNLPIAACTVSEENEILIWNTAFETLSGLPAQSLIGSHLSALPEPWSSLLTGVIEEPRSAANAQMLNLPDRQCWVSVYKNAIGGADANDLGQVIVVEDLTEVKRLEAEVRHSERLASIGKLAAGVAHEIGNPATGIDCLAQNLRLVTDEEEVLKVASQIRQQTGRISNILESLMNFARSGHAPEFSHSGAVVLFDRVEEAIHLLSLSRIDGHVSFDNRLPRDCVVTGDEQLLTQVFINLLSNARDACVKASLKGLESRIVILEHERTIDTSIIHINDTGEGMSDQVLRHAFDPFFTTKGPDKGTGLGLTLVHRIIEEHSGKISYHSPIYPADNTDSIALSAKPSVAGSGPSEPGPASVGQSSLQRGTRVEIRLPLADITAREQR
ncbi:ATP-binding protein [Allohahella sp. A8]|uniref:ATP-binding protein n=1 Tax=Allohahella sp. A8 TaxID=3141461 RepID=UPI003A80442E